MLKSLTPNVVVHDVNETVEFYRDVLGFQLLTSVPETGKFNWAMMAKDGIKMMFQTRPSIVEDLAMFADAPIGASQTLFIEVTDVQALYDDLKNKVHIVHDMRDTFYGTREFYFEDCNGYVLGFSQTVENAAG
ncbi:MAG: VOC family protein [Burkholderiales bacterium]|nr:VOC family protein [Anaerolineae bacterium]